MTVPIFPIFPSAGIFSQIAEHNATDIGAASQARWRAFIEVYDCCDVNGNGKIEDSEKEGNPYWIEVTNIGSGGEKTWIDSDSDGKRVTKPYDKRAGFDPGPGHSNYLFVTDAMDAAGTAVNWALTLWDEKGSKYAKKYPYIPGVIPQNWRVLSGYLYTPNINPYGTRRYGVKKE